MIVFSIRIFTGVEIIRQLHCTARVPFSQQHQFIGMEASCSQRRIVTEVAKEYPDVELLHMYVDNAAMQIVRNPSRCRQLITAIRKIILDICNFLWQNRSYQIR